MRGIVYTGEGVEVTDALEVRGPGPNEVQVRMPAAGVCHSDLSVIDGTIPFPAPAVLGHEGAGVVEAVGDEVRSVKPGDHVVIATLASCGACRACSTGHPTWCRSSLGQHLDAVHLQGGAGLQLRRRVGLRRGDGRQRGAGGAHPQGGAADVGLPHRLRRAHRRRRGAQPGQGAAGDTAAVFGVGGVGLNVIQGLRIAGATRIVAVDTVAAKEALGRQFGATHFVDAGAGDAAAAVRELVPADRESAAGALFPLGGVTWAFDCVGHPAVLRSALDCLDWGGNAVAIGIPPRGTEVAVDVNALAYVDRGLLGCRYGSARPHHDIPLMVDLYRSGLLHARRAGVADPPARALRRGGRRDACRAGGAGRAHVRLDTRHANVARGGGRGREGRAPGRGHRLAPVSPDPHHQQAPAAHLRPPHDRLGDRGGVSSGIDEIMLVTGGTHAGEFLRLLGNGHEFGIDRLSYAYQEQAGGIAEALGLAERFADGGPVLVMLADNVIERSIRPMVDAFRADPVGARILLSEVAEPEHLRHLGVPVFGDGRTGDRIEEKPEDPGLRLRRDRHLLLRRRRVRHHHDLVPSGRGELEITDVNNHYVGEGPDGLRRPRRVLGRRRRVDRGVLRRQRLRAAERRQHPRSRAARRADPGSVGGGSGRDLEPDPADALGDAGARRGRGWPGCRPPCPGR